MGSAGLFVLLSFRTTPQDHTEKSDVIGQETGANSEGWQRIHSLHVLRPWFLCTVNNLRLYLKNEMTDAGEIEPPTQKNTTAGMEGTLTAKHY